MAPLAPCGFQPPGQEAEEPAGEDGDEQWVMVIIMGDHGDGHVSSHLKCLTICKLAGLKS